MPMEYEFPKHLVKNGKCHPGIAEALSLMLMNDEGDNYGDRGLGKGYELTNKVIDKGGPVLAIWFHLVKEDWAKHVKACEASEEANKNRKKGEPKSFPMWASMVMHFGEPITKRINNIANEMVEADTLDELVEKLSNHPTIQQWDDELREYVGFRCAAYRK